MSTSTLTLRRLSCDLRTVGSVLRWGPFGDPVYKGAVLYWGPRKGPRSAKTTHVLSSCLCSFRVSQEALNTSKALQAL